MVESSAWGRGESSAHEASAAGRLPQRKAVAGFARKRVGVGSCVFALLVLSVALLACKNKKADGTCTSDAECTAGQSCIGGVCAVPAAPVVPPEPTPAASAPSVEATPTKQCALIAISLSGPAGTASIGRECDVEVIDDGATLKSDCSMASFFTPKGGGAARQLKGGRFSFDLKRRSEEDGKIKYGGTARESGVTRTVFLTFTQKYDFANGQLNAGANRYTLTFRPCKKK